MPYSKQAVAQKRDIGTALPRLASLIDGIRNIADEVRVFCLVKNL
jgi:hypothetical protein